MPETLLTRRTAQGATALRGGRAWRPTPYQLLGFLCWLLMTLAYWRLPLCCEAGQHAAVVERLKANLLNPRHPTADLPGEGSLYYSPYAVAQGLFARQTGLGGWEVLRVAGPLNLLVLLTGLGRLVRVLTPRPWAPVLALAPMTLLWANLGYPSTFAIGLTFWAWALTGARGRGPVRFVGPSGRPGLMGYAVLGVLYGLILLIHPITGVGAALGAVAFTAGHGRFRKGRGAVLNVRLSPRGRDKPPPARTLITTTTTALLTAALWPYFNAFEAPSLDFVTVQPPRGPTYAWAAQHIRPGEVVIADSPRAAQTIPGYGPNLAAPARRDPALDERERRGRLEDVRAYLSPDSTRAERTAIAHRYHVRWLLLTRLRTVPEEAVVVAWSPRTGEVLARVSPGATR
ncbi:hypothetical protein [Streptomyces cupreus]|uniref:Glycosyltransferase RgtA/B/C/D-like domain-containing protein n=1 Tax=Streptomyces cupreus TaxID=2759956 RepID=A0A7X1MCP7_9ACTN|nr:hypothetical protein [Streptomyces cupreus]MBC2906669.1 hypothetical protein [Streptomyces cupreus]